MIFVLQNDTPKTEITLTTRNEKDIQETKYISVKMHSFSVFRFLIFNEFVKARNLISCQSAYVTAGTHRFP